MPTTTLVLTLVPVVHLHIRRLPQAPASTFTTRTQTNLPIVESYTVLPSFWNFHLTRYEFRVLGPALYGWFDDGLKQWLRGCNDVP